MLTQGGDRGPLLNLAEVRPPPARTSECSTAEVQFSGRLRADDLMRPDRECFSPGQTRR